MFKVLLSVQMDERLSVEIRWASIYLWDSITANPITSLIVNPSARAAINSLVFSPDGSILASGSSTLLPKRKIGQVGFSYGI